MKVNGLIEPDNSWLETEPITTEETMAAHKAIEERSTALAKPNGDAEAVTMPTPMSLMQQAVGNGASVEAMAQLMELQLRWEANEARRAFEVAFAAFKESAPRLDKTKEVSFGAGKTAYKYTPLDHIANELGPLLARHGLSYNWKQESENGTITVTCILRHKAGHSIENTLSGPDDKSGNKNAIQAIGSAVSYLRRYTLLGVLGMATSDEDTDGVTMGNFLDYLASFEAASDTDELQRAFKEAYKEAQKVMDLKAMKLLIEAKDKRKRELQEA